MNILIVGMTAGYGGTENFIVSQVRNKPDVVNVFLLNDKHEKHFAYETEFGEFGVAVLTPKINEKRHPARFAREIAELCKINSIEAILINSNTTGVRYVLELIGAKAAGVRARIIHSHNSSVDSFKGRLNRFLCAPFVRHNWFNVVTNRFACSDLAGLYEFGCQQFNIINNGIDVGRFVFSPETRARLRRELEISDNTTVVLHVGRISTQKNSDFMLRMFLEFASKIKNAVLLFVGVVDNPSDETRKIKRTIEKSHNPNSVRFLGKRTDIPELMSASDVFFLPSIYEGLPIVAVEAQCSGLACVLSDRISSSVSLTKNVEFISLDADVSEWCTALKKARDMAKLINRFECAETVREMGYDIKDSSTCYWRMVCNSAIQ